MKIFLILFVSFYSCSLLANELTVIHGKIESQELSNAILTFFSSKTKLDKTNIEVEVNENGEFTTSFIIEESQIVTIQYRSERIDFFIIPQERIGVLINDKKQRLTIQYFEKDDRQDNAVHMRYNLLFGQKEISLPSNIRISSNLYYNLKTLSSSEKYSLLKDKFIKENEFLNSIINQNVSKEYVDYLEIETRFSYLSYLLEFVNRDELSSYERIEYLNDIVFKKRNTNSLVYVHFLELLIMKSCKKFDNNKTDFFQEFSTTYTCINNSDLLDNKDKEKILGRLIYFDVSPSNVDKLRTFYDSYKLEHRNSELINELDDRIKLALEQKEGKLASDFILIDQNGVKQSLKNYTGKKVLISFWAKWCGVCKAQIMEGNENRLLLKDEQIEFIFISIDDHILTWKKHPITNTQMGIHLWAGNLKDELMNNYNIISLPKTFLLDENGKFLSNFPKPDTEEFLHFIKSQ